MFDEMCRSKERSIVIVVSPLVALMKDQVRAMTERNAQSVFIGDADDEDEGKYQLVFMSPEASSPKETLRQLQRFSTCSAHVQEKSRANLPKANTAEGLKLDLKESNATSSMCEVWMHHVKFKVMSKDKSIPEMTAECIKVKQVHDLQQSFILQTGSSSWEEAT